MLKATYFATFIFFLSLSVNSLANGLESSSLRTDSSQTSGSSTAMAPLKIGDQAPDFKLMNVDESMISLSENYTSGAIVIFTCNHCPFSKAYESRIMELNSMYALRGFPVIAINSNDPVTVPEDGFIEMRRLAMSKNYKFPYLVDDTQEIAKAYGATKTPHVFVLSNENGMLIVKYMGAIDDNADEINSVSQKYVEDAVNALLEGREVPLTETKAIGCSIKWKKK